MILFLDFAGAPFDGNTPTTKAIGGSEMAQIQLAEALAARGAEVKVLVSRDENHEREQRQDEPPAAGAHPRYS